MLDGEELPLAPVTPLVLVAPALPEGAALLKLLPLFELAPVVLLELLPVLPLVPLALDDGLAAELDPLVPDTPVHGATVVEVPVPPDCEISTPATLQFKGTCCSMSSTKLMLLELPPLVVVVEAPLPLLGTALALAVLPAALGLAPAALPLAFGLALELAVVPEDVVEVVPDMLAGRMSMNTTLSPLLAMLRKLPVIGMVIMLEVPVEVLVVLDGLALVAAPVVLAPAAWAALLAPEAPPAPFAAAKEPDHWLWVSICW